MQSRDARWSLLHKPQRSLSVQTIKALQGEIEAIERKKEKKRTVHLKQACLKKNRALPALNNLLYYKNTQALTLLWASTWSDGSIFIANKVHFDHSDLEISNPNVLILTSNIYWPLASWQALVVPACEVFHDHLTLGSHMVRPLCEFLIPARCPNWRCQDWAMRICHVVRKTDHTFPSQPTVSIWQGPNGNCITLFNERIKNGFLVSKAVLLVVGKGFQEVFLI